MKKRIVIVGGGISGLATAFYLSRHLAQQPDAAQITLLESKDRFGGSIQTQMQDGFLMEGGSDSFLSDKPWGTQLCEDLGITSHLISTQVMNRRSFVYLKNRLIDVPKGFYLFAPVRIRTMLATPLFSWPGKFRMGLEPFIPARKNLGDESVGSFVRRRLGQEALDRMGQPMLSGIYSADPEKLSLEATMPRFLELERNFGSLYKGLKAQSPQRSSSTSQASGPRYSLFLSLREGMESLVKEILNQLPSVELKTGSEVTSINNHQGWQVVLADGTKIETDFLCLAMPAHIASRLLINADTNVSGQLNDIPYESVGTVNVAYRNSDLKRSLNGSGFVVPAIEKRQIIACTFSSLKFENRASDGSILMRAFIGGTQNRDILGYSDDRIEGIVCNELKVILGISAKPLFMKIFRYPKAMPQYHVGHLERINNLEASLSKLPGLTLTGNGYRGIGIPDCINQAQKTAEKIANMMKN